MPTPLAYPTPRFAHSGGSGPARRTRQMRGVRQDKQFARFASDRLPGLFARGQCRRPLTPHVALAGFLSPAPIGHYRSSVQPGAKGVFQWDGGDPTPERIVDVGCRAFTGAHRWPRLPACGHCPEQSQTRIHGPQRSRPLSASPVGSCLRVFMPWRALMPSTRGYIWHSALVRKNKCDITPSPLEDDWRCTVG
jgi:hypothetical protein